PLGSSCTRTTVPSPSMVSMSSMMTVNRRFTSVPMGSGSFVLMKTPVAEMLVTYSWMNWSNESNSLLMVTRACCRLPDIVPSATLQIELFDVVLAPGVELDAPHVAALGFGHGGFFLTGHQIHHRGVGVHLHDV